MLLGGWLVWVEAGWVHAALVETAGWCCLACRALGGAAGWCWGVVLGGAGLGGQNLTPPI